jgi:casein kinase II subunit alpha
MSTFAKSRKPKNRKNRKKPPKNDKAGIMADGTYSVARAYTNANKLRPEAYSNYAEHKVNWRSPEPYELIRKIGRGKYSEVFQAVRVSLNEDDDDDDDDDSATDDSDGDKKMKPSISSNESKGMSNSSSSSSSSSKQKK